MKSDASITNKSTKQIARQVGSGSARNYSLLPLLPPFLRVLSVGTGVTSSVTNNKGGGETVSLEAKSNSAKNTCSSAQTS